MLMYSLSDISICSCPGPVGHGWYVVLDRFARSRFRLGSPGFIATKVVLDEGLFGPIHVLGFFAYMTLAEGSNWQACLHRALISLSDGIHLNKLAAGQKFIDLSLKTNKRCNVSDQLQTPARIYKSIRVA